MVIVWDEPKRLANIAKHGFDFAEFASAFGFEDFIVLPARFSRSGRSRSILVGRWRAEGMVTAVVSPVGEEGLALVSLRTASEREKAAYAEA